ncbi:hypothetical protein [Peribacillus frigoritolerans]|uniref:hypothetical protein n=1 Tax=Peribacillus frigoritolerans TaxID=450367 RepID=UPI00227DDAFB|nr:hypothetical protein [Peribacillus frigoritolerans]MCY9140565.1 hypothetical protein [Peribacillus frigoritolerans]
MFKKMLLISMLALSIFGLNSGFASAEETESNEVQVTYYDENDEVFKSETVKSDSTPPILARASTNIDNKTEFSNYVYINNGTSFYNPHHVDFELGNRPKKMSVKAYLGSTYKGKVTFEGAGLAGWQSADLNWLKRGSSYKIAFVNEGSGSVKIIGGYINYN